MQSSNHCEYNHMSLSTLAEKDHVITSVKGEATYMITEKTTGTVSLAAFESKVAANRFFAENNEYFFSKIN